MPRRLFVLLLAGASLFAPTPPSQPVSPGETQAATRAAHQSDAQTKIRVNSDLVVLPVTVKDQFGELVPDLQQGDFRVFDDGVEQSLDLFTVEAFPLSVVVLIDDDLKSKDAAQMAPSLRAITAGISASDEALICRFDLSFYPGDAFTGDLDKLWTDLKNAQDHSAASTVGPVPFVTTPTSIPGAGGQPAPTDLGSRPTKALDDAVHSAAELLHDRGAVQRKIILIVSDGVNGTQFNHHTYTDALESLLRDNISVYSLAVGSGFTKRKFSRLYSRITEQARHEYTLAYVPRGTHPRSAYHKVEVRVARSGVTVKTRQGYYTGSVPDPRAK